MKNAKFVVKKNAKGFGVYASYDYKKGEEIYKLDGKKVSVKDLSRHITDFRRSMVDLLQISSQQYIILDKPSLYFNHSCSPNAGLRGKVTLFALKNIKKGQEITYDYSATVDESFVCQCGSKKCRGVMLDFFGLPKSVQHSYFLQSALQDHVIKKMVKLNKGLCPCGSGKNFANCHKKIIGKN